MWTQQFFFNHFHFLFLAVLLGMLLTLLEKCTYLEVFWSRFSPNIGLYGPEKLCIVLHSIIYSQKNIFNFWFVLAKRNKRSIRIRQNKIENTWCDETFACLQIQPLTYSNTLSCLIGHRLLCLTLLTISYFFSCCSFSMNSVQLFLFSRFSQFFYSKFNYYSALK